MRVSNLFNSLAEIQVFEGGYAFKFRRSEFLFRRITDYLLFERQHSTQLTFTVYAEPNDSSMWLQVRGLERE